MSKKLESSTITLGKGKKHLLIAFILGVGFTSQIQAQSEELKQKNTAFKGDLAQYEMKYLNISSPDMGAIDETDYLWKDEFMLKSLEKQENNLGNRSYQKFYFSIYAYETEDDRKYALSDWLQDFIEGKTIRAGRVMRTYDYATPTIILINDLEIITCNYACSDYSEENFEKWKDMLLKYYGDDNTMVIEVLCDGPLEWTKNAPDPRERKKYF